MSQKWKLQDIKPAQPKKRREPSRERELQAETTPVAEEREDIPEIAITDGRKKKRFNMVIAVALFLVVVGGGVVVSALMSGAEVTVHPRERTPNLNAEFIAYPEPRAGELSYEIMSLQAEGERQVTATGEEEVNEQATGIIEIIKTTPGSERLIKNTRFESPEGLIFKITESVVVPGAVEGEDGSTVPGSIRAEVFAESPGEEYNLEAGTRFTIPGFAEGGFDELFRTIYAENRTDFTGGYSGPRFIIDDEELATAKQALQMELRDSLLERVDDEKPANFVVFDGAVAFTYNTLPPVEYGDDLVTIKEQATLQIPIFRESDFAQYIAAQTVPGYEGGPVRIQNLEDLSFTYNSATTSGANIADLPSISFKLSGQPHLIWEYDEAALKSDLSGKPRTALKGIMQGYSPAVERASAVVRPFWKRSFPDSPDEITINEVIGEE